MRKKVYTSLVVLGLALSGAGALLQAQWELESSVFKMRAKSWIGQGYGEWRELSVIARERARLYEQAIERDHISKGMVVNRSLRSGRAESECDSLLFSSLRYVALHKLAEVEEAEKAWQGLVTNSYQDGRWLRHPDCRRKATSRDMIVGLMAALSQNPPEHARQLKRLLAIIERTGGSVDDGPFYVSRLSPGMGELLKQMASLDGVEAELLPIPLRLGFSTVEFDTWIAEPGFRSHLNALTLWIELELVAKNPGLEIRSLSGLADKFAPASWATSFAGQRRAFAARELYELEPDNMFFEYLYLRAAGALNYNSKTDLLKRLLAMPQFPLEGLPRDCDRRADYLWQRSAREYGPKRDCKETFHGVDFLWMTALLTEDNQTRIASVLK